MAATPIDLYNDVVNNVLVLGLNNKERFNISSRSVFQGSKLPIRWYPVRPTNSVTAPFFTLLPVAGLTLDICIGPRAGSESLLARQNVWAENVGGYLEATLNLNTAELNAAVGTSDSFSTFFEINLTDAGDERPVYQDTINIVPVVKGPGTSSSLPTAAIEYLTATQIRAEFVRFFNNPVGSTIELTSPDGSHTRLIGCNDDGTAQDEIA